MTSVRFLIEVDDAWNVAITCPEHRPDWRLTRAMGAVESSTGRFPTPPPGGCPEAHVDHRYCMAEANVIREVYEDVALYRQPREEHTLAAFGRYLFDSLLGPDAWSQMEAIAGAVDARTIELALSWPARYSELNRLNWELMHDGDGFLIAGRGRAAIAITRVVPATVAEGKVLQSPPRVLFVIGAPLTDPEVRPGVEFLGVIRQVESTGLRLNHRVLERASPTRLRDALHTFRPDVVHFICHGEVDQEDGQACLVLQPDEADDQGPQRRYADQLLADLEIDGHLPAAVVLSACHTGGTRLLGAHETAPLAARLVAGGIPVVLGMAGRVSDRACRLFTRRFTASVLAGESIVAATALARKAAFADGPPPWRSVDWAFPALFLSAEVDADYRPVPDPAPRGAEAVDKWISDFGLEQRPIFCGRAEFFATVAQSTNSVGPAVIAISVPISGLGRTRLLQELARQAILDGNIPLLVGTRADDDGHFSLVDLCRAVQRAVARARLTLDILPPNGQLKLLANYNPTQDPDPAFDRHIATMLEEEGNEVTGLIFRLAAQRDFARLAADARRKHPHIGEAKGRVILLVDGIDDNSTDVVKALFEDGVLTKDGLGSDGERVPVVLAFQLSGREGILKDIDEERIVKPWLKVMRLRPFQHVDDEDLLAYEQILLNPFKPTLDPGITDVPWVFNREFEDTQQRDKYIKNLRNQFKGLPSFFNDSEFYAVVRWTESVRFVLEANDDELVRRTLEAK